MRPSPHFSPLHSFPPFPPFFVPPDPSSRYIIVSFTDATLVLAVGETVEEATDSGLERKFPTLACALLEDDVILQVHTAGVRQVRVVGGVRRVSEWPAPGRKTIVKACCNTRQCVVALTGGELMYFELDETVRGVHFSCQGPDSRVLSPVHSCGVRATVCLLLFGLLLAGWCALSASGILFCPPPSSVIPAPIVHQGLRPGAAWWSRGAVHGSGTCAPWCPALRFPGTSLACCGWGGWGFVMALPCLEFAVNLLVLLVYELCWFC
jgi:hypothetical protein